MTAGGEDLDYGEIVAGPYEPDRGRVAQAIAASGAGGLFCIGLAGYFLRDAVTRPRRGLWSVATRERLYPFFVLLMGAVAWLLFAVFVYHLWKGRYDRVELRRDGVVRVSHQYGTKRFRYADVATVETKRTDRGEPWALFLTMRDDSFVSINDVQGFASLERELRARCPDA